MFVRFRSRSPNDTVTAARTPAVRPLARPKRLRSPGDEIGPVRAARRDLENRSPYRRPAKADAMDFAVFRDQENANNVVRNKENSLARDQPLKRRSVLGVLNTKQAFNKQALPKSKVRATSHPVACPRERPILVRAVLWVWSGQWSDD